LLIKPSLDDRCRALCIIDRAPKPRAALREWCNSPRVVQSILDSVREHVLAAPGFDPKSVHRSFTNAMTDVGEVQLLPKLLVRLMSEAPSVDVRTVLMPPRDLMTALQKGVVDLAMGSFPDLGGSDILQSRLYSASFVCVARAGHPTESDQARFS
jgi:DNA-binding transcriptional LysR family regulator